MNGKTLPGWLGCLAATVLLGGCATSPRSPAPDSPSEPVARQAVLGTRIAGRALSLVGRPYLYGGNGPEAFDCSGLVRFVHRDFGIETPRTTVGQFAAARPVPAAEIAAGDLLFFRIGSRVSHVAIYLGDGRFVHAPQTGRPVETRLLEDDYYKPRLAGAGRFH